MSINRVYTYIILNLNKVVEITLGLNYNNKPTIKEFKKEFQGGIEDLMGLIMSFIRICTMFKLDIY